MPFFDQGVFKTKITAQRLELSSKKRTPTFVLEHQPFAKIDTAEPGRQETPVTGGGQYPEKIRMYITEGTIDRVVKALRTMGFPGQNFSDLDPGNPGYYDLVGTEVEVVNSHDEHDGKTRDQWQIATGSGSIITMPAQDLRNLDALFGKNLRDAPKVAQQQDSSEPTTQPASNTETKETGDDLPF